MASKSSASAALFLCLNLILFTSANAETTCSITNLSTLNVCADLLGINVLVGSPPYSCCNLIAGLDDLEAATCLCLAIKANILNILNLTVDIAISNILDNCQRSYPANYHCAL